MTPDSFNTFLKAAVEARHTAIQTQNALNIATVPGLREWRVSRGISLRKAAGILGVSYGFLSKVETGKPGYPISKDLADRLLANWD